MCVRMSFIFVPCPTHLSKSIFALLLEPNLFSYWS